MLVAVLWPRALTDGAKYLHEMMIISSYFSTFMKRVVLHIFGHSFFPSSFFFNGQLRYFPLFFFVGLQTSIMWNKFTTIACHQMAVLFIFDWGQSHLSQCQKGWIEFELNFNQPISDLNLILGPCDQFFFRLLFFFFFFVCVSGGCWEESLEWGQMTLVYVRKTEEKERWPLSLHLLVFFLYIYYGTHNIPHKRFRLAYFSSGFALYRKGGKIFFPNRRRFGHVIVCKLASSQQQQKPKNQLLFLFFLYFLYLLVLLRQNDITKSKVGNITTSKFGLVNYEMKNNRIKLIHSQKERKKEKQSNTIKKKKTKGNEAHTIFLFYGK